MNTEVRKALSMEQHLRGGDRIVAVVQQDRGTLLVFTSYGDVFEYRLYSS